MSMSRRRRGSRPSSRSSTRASAETTPPDLLRLRIESLAYGGAGVGRHERRAVFVSRTAPGDLVEVEVPRKALTARLLRVLEPGGSRVEARCVHVDECSGCQWQHVAVPAQGEAKRQALVEALVRLGGVDRAALQGTELFASPFPFAYRRRARFRVRTTGALSYAGEDGRPGPALRECKLLAPDLERLALVLSEALRRIVPRPSQVSVCVAGGRGSAALEFQRPMASASLRSLGERLLAEVPALSGAVLRAGDRSVEVGVVTLQDGSTALRPDVFAQANPRVNEQLVAQLLERLAPSGTDSVLELYAGSGNFTVPLAGQAAEVVAVEREGRALDLLQRAVVARQLANVRTVSGDAARVLRKLYDAHGPFDLAVLDPPRAGAREALSGLRASRPRRIAYVSCDPSTLARDVKVLAAGGYAVKSAAVFDQFPQTYHLEALVVLER